MRITKVKVNKETVRFNRHSKDISPESTESKKGCGELMRNTLSFKIDKKHEEFQNSVFNSLVLLEVKPQKKDNDKSILKAKLDSLTQVLKGYFFCDNMNLRDYDIRQCAKITETDLKRLLNRKGLNTLNIDNEGFELSDAILEFAETGNLKCFDKTKKWVHEKIKNKKKGISKSIEENRIAFNFMNTAKEDESPVFQLGVSSKKNVLNDLITKNFSIERFLNTINETYKIQDLASALQAIEQTYIDKDGKTCRCTDLNFKFKSCLQLHQAKLFGKESSNCDANRADEDLQFVNIEVTKYLETNFPIKKKNEKRNRSEEDIKRYIEANTIRKTIEFQIRNAIGSHLRDLGQLINYHYNFDKKEWINKEFESTDLQIIKIKETFQRKLCNDISFAANRIYNELNLFISDELTAYFATVQQLTQEWKNVPTTDEERNERVRAIDCIINRLEYEFQFPVNELIEYKAYLLVYNSSTTGSDKGAYNKKYPEVYKLVKNKFDALVDIKGKIQTITDQDVLQADINIFKNLFPSTVTIDSLLVKLKAIYALRNGIFHQQTMDFNTVNGINAIQKEFQLDCDNAQRNYIHKLCSNNVLSYYEKEQIATIFKDRPISLSAKSIAFAPAFKNVLTRANNLKMTWGVPVTNRDPQQNAKYFLLNFLYYQFFLPEFTTNSKGLFKKVIDKLKEKNNPRKGSKEGYAYKDLLGEYNNCSPDEYLAKIQSLETDRTQIQEKADVEKEQPYFQRILWDIFGTGFANYLKHFLDVIENPLAKQDSKHDLYLGKDGIEKAITEYKDIIKVNLDACCASDVHHQHWFCLCSLLDQNRLNSLRNDILKYEQAFITILKYKKVEKESKGYDSKILDTNYTELIAIVNLSMLSADVVNLDTVAQNKEDYFRTLSAFLPIETENDLKELEPKNPQKGQRSQMYMSDDELVCKRGVEKTRIYGTLNILKGLETKISKETIEEFYQKEIEAASKSKEKIAKYKELVQFETKYQNLSNQVHLVYLERINNLLQDVFAHWVSLTHLFERDMYFVFLGFSFYKNEENKDKENKEKEEKDREKEKEKENKAKDRSKLGLLWGKDETFNNLLKDLFNVDTTKSDNHDADNDSEKIRNRIAHFEYFRKQHFSLIDLLNQLRTMLAYDRKLKNAVSKSFIDTFKTHGMILELQLNSSHKLAFKSIEPKKIYHLGSKGKKQGEITSDQVSADFCELCEALLKLTK